MSGTVLSTRVSNFVFLLRNLLLREILINIRFRVSSDTVSFSLRRDLCVPFHLPDARIPLTIRPLVESDIALIFDPKKPGITADEKRDLNIRLDHLRSGVPTCYVAVSEHGEPMYIQWLMGPGDNDRIQAHFNRVFPVLASDEALLENAFTLGQFRGRGIMPAAMARIAERGRDIGARWVITFVEESNIASLKGCKRSGFYPYMLRHETWFLFRRKLTFTLLPENTPYPFDTVETQ